MRRRTLLAAAGGTAAVLCGARAAGAAPAPPPAGGTLTESVVWAAGEDGVAEHFVYGFGVTPRGTVLAFSEARIATADAGAHHLVAKRSTDGGMTWDASTVLESGADGSCWANPAVVVDPATGRTTVFYVLNSGNASTRVFFRTSRDEGTTWSERTEITGLFDGSPAGWTFHMPGPGHGIALHDGRLVLQLWHRKDVTVPVALRAYGVSVITSDDHGHTWTAGGTVPVDPAYPVNESRIVERADGTLLMNGRYSSGGVHPRITAVSTDRGASWSPPAFTSAVRPYTAVDSSLARLSGGRGRPGPSRLLFSRPDSTTSRSNLSVGVSYDEGLSFPFGAVVTPGPASYSDLAHLTDGTILLLYGKGLTASRAIDHVAVARFGLEWLTQGHDSVHTGPDLREFRYEAERAPVGAVAGAGAPIRVADPNASGGRLLLLPAATAGASLTLRLTVPRSGRYAVAVRCRQSPHGPTLALSLDGQPLGPAFSTLLADGTGFAEFPCGSAGFDRPGPYRVTLTVVAPAAGADTADVAVDYVALRSYGGATDPGTTEAVPGA